MMSDRSEDRAKRSATLKETEDACARPESTFGGCAAPPNPKLVAEGWQRRFVADSRMAKDALESYTQLGYEVKLEPLATSAVWDECRECHILLKNFSVVYTRKSRRE